MKRVKRGQEVNKKIFEPSIFFFIFSNPEFFLSGKCQVIGRWHTIGLPLPEAASEKYFFLHFILFNFFIAKKSFSETFFSSPRFWLPRREEVSTTADPLQPRSALAGSSSQNQRQTFIFHKPTHSLSLSLSPSDTRLAFSFSHSVVSFKQTQSNFSQVPTQSLLLSKFASPPSHSLSLTHSLSHSVFYSVTFSHSLSLSNSLFTLYFFFSLSFYLTHLFLLY